MHTEQSIIKKIRSYFQNGYHYRIDNAFIFGPDWECDFFCTNREGWAFEFEVKISRADFKNDFKKYKHEVFTTGFHTEKHEKYNTQLKIYEPFVTKTERKFIPNRFYYVTPAGLIAVNELPDYAGLIEIGNYVKIIKRAPFIHKRKLDVRKALCDKFYWRWIEERRRNNILENENKRLIKDREENYIRK